MTFGGPACAEPAGAEAAGDELGADLFCEQPTRLATVTAASVMPTEIPCFPTGLLRCRSLSLTQPSPSTRRSQTGNGALVHPGSAASLVDSLRGMRGAWRSPSTKT